MSRIHLVRHGETVWHAENRYAGHSDVPLSAEGERQTRVLAEWAKTARIGRVASSDLSRARLTAAAAATACALEVAVDSRLREANFGRGEGLTADEMRSLFPAERDAFVRAPATSALPGGERGDIVAERFVAALRDIARESSGATLVVAHSTAIRLSLCSLLGIPLDMYRVVFPSLGNVAITTIELPDSGDPRSRTALLSFNLPPATAAVGS